MQRDKRKTKWILDATIFGGFLLALWLDLTGVVAHQWLGLAVGILAGYHLWARWCWVRAVTGRLLGRTSNQARLYYVVDLGLAAGLWTIVLTGLAISTWLDLSLASGAAWRNVHVWASILTLALLVVKIGLHWRWIASVARRSFFRAPLPAGTNHLQPAPAASGVDRRDFLRIMGIAGAAALLAGVNVLADQDSSQAAPSTTQATAATEAAAGATALASTSQTSTTTSCTVRCSRGCSYPGHCRRYVDSNGNGRCDLGECQTG